MQPETLNDAVQPRKAKKVGEYTEIAVLCLSPLFCVSRFQASQKESHRTIKNRGKLVQVF
jgi:hypothetical protein